MKPLFFAIAASLTLSACGQSAQDDTPSTSGAEVADQLDQAADQSGPAAQQVLESAAAEAREHPSMAPAGQPGSFAQDAMQKAGEAEAAALASGTIASPGAR